MNAADYYVIHYSDAPPTMVPQWNLVRFLHDKRIDDGYYCYAWIAHSVMLLSRNDPGRWISPAIVKPGWSRWVREPGAETLHLLIGLTRSVRVIYAEPFDPRDLAHVILAEEWTNAVPAAQ